MSGSQIDNTIKLDFHVYLLGIHESTKLLKCEYFKISDKENFK